MSGFELNKIAGAILLAGLVAMVVGSFADALYHPNLNSKNRGYQIAVKEESSSEAEEAKPINIADLMKNANADLGKDQAKKCAICHSFDNGGSNRVGPNLWGIVNNKKAHSATYSYSDAMKKKGGKWTYDELVHYLMAPRSFVPGTKMSFAGFSKPEDAANIVAFLRTLSDNPEPLP